MPFTYHIGDTNTNYRQQQLLENPSNIHGNVSLLPQQLFRTFRMCILSIIRKILIISLTVIQKFGSKSQVFIRNEIDNLFTHVIIQFGFRKPKKYMLNLQS